MFDKNKFAQILKNINDTYNSQRDFAKKSEINRTYLSQYMNMKLDEPPKPKILEKLANSSHGITTYNNLMEICGYTNKEGTYKLLLEDTYSITENDYLNRLNHIKLTNKEKEVYDDIFLILPNNIYNNPNSHEVRGIISSYINNLDFLPIDSKNKIIDKLVLFVEYSFETDKIRNKILNLNIDNKNSEITSSQYYMCPVYGQISAGQPNWAEENIEGRIMIDPDLMGIVNPEEHFFLRVNRRIDEQNSKKRCICFNTQTRRSK